jgi:hypothetical protein
MNLIKNDVNFEKESSYITPQSIVHNVASATQLLASASFYTSCERSVNIRTQQLWW